MSQKFVIEKPHKTEIKIHEDSVHILRSGWSSFFSHGYAKELVIPYNTIENLSFDTPRVTAGYIRFNIVGETGRPKNVLKATRDEYTVLYNTPDLETATKLFEMLTLILVDVVPVEAVEDVIVEDRTTHKTMEIEVPIEPEAEVFTAVEEPVIEVTETIEEKVDLSEYDELIKLKELLDLGIITPEDYDKKKAEILGL